jgi:hypothetical protein
LVISDDEQDIEKGGKEDEEYAAKIYKIIN